MYVPRSVMQYAREDFDAVVTTVSDKHPEWNLELLDIEYDSYSTEDSNYDSAFVVDATGKIKYTINDNSQILDFIIEYFIGDDDVFYAAPDGLSSLSDDLEIRILEDLDEVRSVESSTNLHTRSAVFGADDEDDLDEGMEFDDFSDADDLSDKVDDIADDLDDLKDDFMESDNTDIEVDNNIENHYIAECESCHGIFISALVESDQAVDSVHGVCPLCGEESDQDLKWIVRSISDAAEPAADNEF